MKTQDAINKIRKFNGPIHAGVLIKNDVIYVRVLKGSLIDELAELPDDSVEVSELGGVLYIDNCD